MKDKRKLFGLVLAVFAGLSFWWLALQDSDQAQAPAAAARLPDSYFNGLNIVSHGEDGKPVSRLQAAHATHFPDDPLIYLEDLRTRGLEANDSWILKATHGKFNPDTDILNASGTVRLSRLGEQSGSVPAVLSTDKLEFDAQAERATTDSPVEITQGKSHVRGIGLVADLGNNHIEIPARVEARYEE